MDGAVRTDEDAICGGYGSGRSDLRIRAEVGGSKGCAAGAVVQADLQCFGERCRCADGVAAQLPFFDGKGVR